MIDWIKPIRTKSGIACEYIGLTKDDPKYADDPDDFHKVYPRLVSGPGGTYPYTESGSFVIDDKCSMDLENIPNAEEKSAAKKFDYNKPFRTSRGDPARLLGELAGSRWGKFAVAMTVDDAEFVCYGDENGKLYAPGCNGAISDLVNIEPETYVTLVLYRSNNGELYVHAVLYDDPLNDLSVYEVGKEYIGTMRMKLKPDEMGNEP